MAEISIIVPVHNSEIYLDRCINSLLTQTYKDIEIIIVDDASIDNSANIMREYEQKYSSYIKCFYLEETVCAGGARNVGIINASGKYVTFVDSDDYIKQNMLELMVNKIKLKNADACICNCIISDVESGNNTLHNCFYKEATGTLDFYKKRINILLNDGVCWGILIKTSILRNNKIYFPENNMCEDYVWKCVFWLYISSVTMVEEGLYVYIRHKASLSHTNENRKADFEKSIQWLKSWQNNTKHTVLENKLFLYGIFKCLNFLLLYYNCQKNYNSKYISILTQSQYIYNYLKGDDGIYLNETILKGKPFIDNTGNGIINNSSNCQYTEKLYYYKYNLFKSYIDNIIDKYKSYGYSTYIFGAGKKGTEFLEAIDKNKCKIDGVIDTDSLKWEKKTSTGHIILNINEVICNKSVVLIINRYYSSFVEKEISGFQNIEIKLINLDIELCKNIKVM